MEPRNGPHSKRGRCEKAGSRVHRGSFLRKIRLPEGVVEDLELHSNERSLSERLCIYVPSSL